MLWPFIRSDLLDRFDCICERSKKGLQSSPGRLKPIEFERIELNKSIYEMNIPTQFLTIHEIHSRVITQTQKQDDTGCTT